MNGPISTTMQLAQTLRGYRKKAGLSQTEAGSAVGLQQKTISALERSPGGSKIENLFRLLAALDLEIVIQRKPSPDSIADHGEW